MLQQVYFDIDFFTLICSDLKQLEPFRSERYVVRTTDTILEEQTLSSGIKQ